MSKNIKEPKKTRRRRMSNKKAMIKTSYIITSTVAILFVSLFVWGFNFVINIVKATEQFDTSKLSSQEVSRIYDQNGELIWRLNSIEAGTRENVTYDDLPQVLVDAVIAAEDSRYFEHNGFDLPRIVRAFISNISGGQLSGASTITQQIIKKSYFPEEQTTYQRKIGEVYLAIQANDELSKEKILESYLNKIYFGRELYSIGIQSASHYYFKKDVTELTLPEAALLAGTLNSPASYDPFYNLELATRRRDTILDLMNMHGYITEAEKEAAKLIRVEDTLVSTSSVSGDYYPNLAYIDAVISEVKEVYGIDPTETAIDIYTFMDSDLQTQLDSLAKGEVNGFTLYDEQLEIASSVLETNTGRIVGLIGGRDYVSNKDAVQRFNRATMSKQSPGSSMKPITAYSGTFEFLDWSTAHTLDDSPYTNAGVTVTNWDNQNHENVLLIDALLNSWNITAVRAFEEVSRTIGSEAHKSYLKGFGLTIDSINNPEDDFNSFYSIGGMRYGWTTLQLAAAYATIVNDGVYIEPHTINYIKIHSDGRILNRDQEALDYAARACSEETAFMVRYSMLSYAGQAHYRRIAVPNVQIAGKTGTSTYDNGSSKASIMTGFSPDYSVASWVGYDSGSKVISETTSSYDLTGEILRFLHSDGTTKNSFSTAPNSLTQATIIRGAFPPYVLASDLIPDDRKTVGWFKGNNRPVSFDLSSLALENLAQFSAEQTNNFKNIRVSFSGYPNPALTTDFKPDDHSIETIFGRVQYTTTIKDMNNTVLQTFTNNEGNYTVDYSITNDIKVCGKYNYELSQEYASNEICVTIKGPVREPDPIVLPEITASATINGVNVDNQVFTLDEALLLNVVVARSIASNIVLIEIIGGTSTNLTNSTTSASLNITEVGNYTIKITEQDKDRKTQKTKVFQFNVRQNP